MTLKIGFNFSISDTTPVPVFSNLMKTSGDWRALQFNLSRNLKFDTFGDVVFGDPAITGITGAICDVVTNATNMIDPKGYPALAWGQIRIYYDGDLDANGQPIGSVGIYSDTTDATVVSQSIGKEVGNEIVLNLTQKPGVQARYGPEFSLVVRATAAGQPARNIRIYDAISDPASTDPWHPSFRKMIAGAQIIRDCFICGGNGSTAVQPEDYATPEQRSFASTDFRTVYLPIQSVKNYTDTTSLLPVSTGQPWVPALLTFAAPHGLTHGQAIQIGSTSGNPVELTLANGSFMALSHGSDRFTGTVFYDPTTMSPNQLVIVGRSEVNTPGPITILGGYNGDAELILSPTPTIPPKMVADLVASLPGCDYQMSLPHSASDALITWRCGILNKTLPADRQIVVTGSNEAWNAGLAYPQFQYWQGLATSHDGSWEAGYAARLGAMHTVAAKAFGSRPFLRAFEGQFWNPWLAGEIARNASVQGLPFDVMNVAPYTLYEPPTPGIEGQTIDQVLAGVTTYLNSNAVRSTCQQTLSAVQTYYPNAILGSYEGSIGNVSMSGVSDTRARENQAAWHHPGIAAVYRLWLSRLADGGMQWLCYFTLARALTQAEGSNPSPMYGLFQAWNMPPGPNDGFGPNKYDPRPSLAGVPPGVADQSLSESPIAWALLLWRNPQMATAAETALTAYETTLDELAKAVAAKTASDATSAAAVTAAQAALATAQQNQTATAQTAQAAIDHANTDVSTTATAYSAAVAAMVAAAQQGISPFAPTPAPANPPLANALS